MDNIQHIPFIEFPKMGRYSREVIITEKIDGTNASINIIAVQADLAPNDSNIIATIGGYNIRAGSRTKWITPGKNDNAGFAGWVSKNVEELVGLGEGQHFGEWWGSGIQRGYGLLKGEKRFSLFNVKRWDAQFEGSTLRPSIVGVVPVLAVLSEGFPLAWELAHIVKELAELGSVAAPGFMDPEGIVIYHTAGNVGFKKTIKNDESPKSLVK